MTTQLNQSQKEHLAAFNKFATMENEQILEFITKHYKGSGATYFGQLTNQLEEDDYSELSKNLLLFGNIKPEDHCRIFFMEELEEMEDDEIVSLFKDATENGHVLINYFAQNRMAGFDVEEIQSTFGVTEQYMRDKFSLYFASKGI